MMSIQENKPKSGLDGSSSSVGTKLSASSIARDPHRFYEYFYGSEENRNLIRQHYGIYMLSQCVVSPETMADLKLTHVDALPERVAKVADYLRKRKPLPWNSIRNEGAAFLESAQDWKGFLKDVELFPAQLEDIPPGQPNRPGQVTGVKFINALKTGLFTEEPEFLSRRLVLGLFGIQTILQASTLSNFLSETALATYYSSLRTPLLGLNTLLLQEPIRLPRPVGTESTKHTTLHKSQYCIPDGLLLVELPELQSTLLFFDFQKSKVDAADEAAFMVSASPRLRVTGRLEFFACSLEDKAYDEETGTDSWETPQRQNMISTSALLRHLKSFGVESEVLNIVWTRWSVRVSVDFCESLQDGGLRFCSYIIPPNPDRPEKMFWSLSDQRDIQDLYEFLVRVKEWSREVFARKVKKDLLAFMKSDRRWGRWANSAAFYSPQFDPSEKKLPPTPRGSQAGSKKTFKKKFHPLAQKLDLQAK